MPQNRRKVAFSGKQKKLQKQQKQLRKASYCIVPGNGQGPELGHGSGLNQPLDELEMINRQPVQNSRSNPNRYNLVFKKEKALSHKDKLELAREPFDPLPEEQLEISFMDVFDPGTELDMPMRPPWNYDQSKESLEAHEHHYFRDYVQNLEKRCGDNVSHFDMNLENWRQLWRVLEFSDIVLLVADVRHPVFHFSPALYDYVVKKLKKDIIVVLNKIDLVPAPLVLAWKQYFSQTFPQIHVLCFASYAGMKIKEGKQNRRIGNLHMAIAGVRQLLELCQEIVGNKVDLSSWKTKIDREAEELSLNKIISSDDQNLNKMTQNSPTNDTSYYNESKYKDGVLTLGFVGHPNVGKSSFLNAVMGKKVTSVSKTPGHTKHYQTIWLTPTVRLCDCPGLVFPSLAPRSMQVLMGCYPIAQLRDPYPVISYLSQRTCVPRILKLQHPDYDSKHPNEVLQWSAYDICETWAQKRGYFTAKAARPDVFRASNSILRMALDGRTICLAFHPPHYAESKEMWANHAEVAKIEAIQAHRICGRTNGDVAMNAESASDDDVSSEEVEAEEMEFEVAQAQSVISNKFSMLADLD